jgi:sugar phosphate isomerase/epimerase
MMPSRREFLQAGAALGAAAFVAPQLFAATAATPFSAKLGWTIGPQIYSFNRFTFEDAVKKVKETGASSFEQYTFGMTVSKDVQVKVGPDLLKPENKDALKRVKDLLEKYQLKIHAVGVCGSERADFDFAAEFRIPVLNAEPGSAGKVEAASKLADEYKINVGLHNHPKDSHYWNPQTVLDEIKNASPRVGACADTGHWLRSGLNPVECLQKLKGHIVAFHIKDLKKTADGKLDADCIFGKGEVGIADVLKEVAAQGFKGPFSIEYEAAWDNNVPQIKESVAFFENVAKEIAESKAAAATPREKARDRAKSFRNRLKRLVG